jgi:methylated-DNA-[protein]-cysteine S-methyltransferase
MLAQRVPRPSADPVTNLRHYRIPTRLGEFEAAFSANGLRRLTLPAHPRKRELNAAAWPTLESQESSLGEQVLETLLRRLDGEKVDFPWDWLDLDGRPPFHRKAWRVLYEIPFGQTAGYAEVAARAGSPGGARAAGQACGANPVVLFIPCHRVLAAVGPGGFGAGLTWKAELLKLEGYRL